MGLYLVGHDVVTINRHKFGLEPTAKNPSALVAVGARQDSSAQGSVNVNGTCGDDFCA
jgi:hypothetical protein